MRKQRKVENEEERREQLKQEAERALDGGLAAEAALDERIRRNIELYGP